MFSGPMEDIFSGVGPAARDLGRSSDPIATAQLMLFSQVPGARVTDAGDFAMPARSIARDDQLLLSGDARQRRVWVQRLVRP